MKFISETDLFLLEEVIRKNFSSKYKDSVLGILWSVLHPLCMVIVLTIIFSTMLGRGIENYPVYLLSGRSVFSYFTGTIGSSMGVIKSNKNILKKTSSPKYVFVLGTVISEFLNFIISFILLIAVMIVTSAPLHLTMLLAFVPLISLLMMVTGLSLFMSVISVYYSDVRYIWRVVSQMLLYSSALFYLMDRVPEPYHQYLILNPVYWIIEQFRDFVMFGVIPNPMNIVNSYLLSAIILVFGVIIFKKYENNLMMQF